MANPYTQGAESITQAEHIGPAKTGDNIQAKRAAGYGWGGSEWGRNPLPFLTKPFDEIIITYTDDTKETLSSIVTKLSSVTQETLTITQPTTASDRFVRS